MNRNEIPKPEGGGGNENSKAVEFKPRDLIKNIIEHPYGICDKQKVVYYTSPIDIKPNIDEEMDRINKFFDYTCISVGSESVLGMRN